MESQRIEAIIQTRKTEKVLADPVNPLPVPADFAAQVAEMIAVAGHAPFHKEAAAHHRSGELAAAVPWRFYVLDGAACRAVLRQLQAWGGAFMRGKVPQMLAAAGALVQVTWLPDDDNWGSQPNLEHVAATAAATQNLLLTATARGIANYWSSGGVLREPALYELLDIPLTEPLLGAIFLFPQTEGAHDVLGGKNRGKHAPAAGWSQWVAVADAPDTAS